MYEGTEELFEFLKGSNVKELFLRIDGSLRIAVRSLHRCSGVLPLIIIFERVPFQRESTRCVLRIIHDNLPV